MNDAERLFRRLATSLPEIDREKWRLPGEALHDEFSDHLEEAMAEIREHDGLFVGPLTNRYGERRTYVFFLHRGSGDRLTTVQQWMPVAAQRNC